MAETAAAQPCLVVADVSGSQPLYAKLGAAEGKRAVERCLNRMERVVMATGEVLQLGQDEIVALFPNASEGLFSAAEILELVKSFFAANPLGCQHRALGEAAAAGGVMREHDGVSRGLQRELVEAEDFAFAFRADFQALTRGLLDDLPHGDGGSGGRIHLVDVMAL